MPDIKEFEKKEITKKNDISDTLNIQNTNTGNIKKTASKYQISHELDKFENTLMKKRSSSIQ